MPVSPEELNQWLAEADGKITLEMVQNDLTEEQWEQQERAKYRWRSPVAPAVTREMLNTTYDLLADFNTGIVSLLGPDIQNVLADVGLGRRAGEPPRLGTIGRGAEVGGQAVSLAGGLGSALTRGGVRLGTQLGMRSATPSVGTRVAEDIAQTIERSPGGFLGMEAAGGFGAGAAGEAARQAGESPESQMIASLAGGIGAGVLPTVTGNMTRAARNWALAKVAPWLDKGETLLALRLQRLSADPEAAAKRVLANKREGVSPARASEEQNLLALEARGLEDDPTMAAEFARALEGARIAAQSELRDFAGEMRQPGDWERSVIEKVAAPGTIIKMDNPQRMLKQAYDSFRPQYEDFSGYPIRPQIETPSGDKIPLQRVFDLNVSDPTILVSASERKAATRILEDELTRLSPGLDTKLGTVDSSVLLTVRQNLRDDIRSKLASKNRQDHATAMILTNAEAALTTILKQQLPDGAMQTLKTIDDQYNVYQVIDRAVTTAGDKPLNPDMVGSAIKQMLPGMGGEQLRQAARAGRGVETVLGDPRAARLLVSKQPKSTVKAIQSDFFDTMWQRSLTRELASDDTPLVSGERYLQNLVKYKSEAAALGIDKESMNRAMFIAREIRAIEAKSPKALRALIEDGPATFMQLISTLIGAKSGQHLSQLGPGAGLGSGLVMARFTSERARRIMSIVFRDDATELFKKASTDKVLYAALLTKSTAPKNEQEKAARVIAAWMEPAIRTAAEED